ncbi:ROK family protein [Altererythrobacter sp. ZODW24]|uniref:ROK family protein n=1 Tax=Altererythrobacter sp. ZODW24 TaxID=2185142 RepID=UPI001F075D11|nr:ROK family protein [Altererythrobacter sp. ZODW24]
MKTASQPMLGAIEAGGTKLVLAIGPSPDVISERSTIETQDPATTLAEARRWFSDRGDFAAIGIATFGPARIDPHAEDWGHILPTTKPGWTGCDMAGFFQQAFAVPVGFDTDVNGAALGECYYGNSPDETSLAYVTVGTGIGGGLVIDGKPVHGIAHAEMGHILTPRAVGDHKFAGVCPHHGDCLEGLASGPAIIARWGKSLSELPADHPAHDIIASYLSQLCHTIFSMTSVPRIILGGGVMQTPGLLENVRRRMPALDCGYLPGGTAHQISAPSLGQNSGIVGALLLAKRALDRSV